MTLLATIVKRSLSKDVASVAKKLPLAGVEKVLLVASAKGGVGKSTVAVNLAVAMQRRNRDKSIGLMDADVYGPSIPIMMKLSGRPQVNDQKLIIPPVSYGVKCMSMGLLVDPEQPIVWRGLMVMSAVDTLLRKVKWGPLHCLIVDMPPGTGDTQLSIAQSVPIDGVLLVTTPQDVALHDARKGAEMFRKIGVNIVGLVENMSTFKCSRCNHETPLYGDDEKLKRMANALDVPILGKLPFETDIVSCSDNGAPAVRSAADAFDNIAERLEKALGMAAEAKPTQISN